MIGLDKLEVVTIFKRHLRDTITDDSLVKSIAMSVGEVIDENNRRILKDLQDKSPDKVGR